MVGWGLSSASLARFLCSVATCAGMWGQPRFRSKLSYNAGLLNKFVLFCGVDGKEKSELFGNHCWK